MKLLTELEKDVLDEYILDIKSNFEIIKVHEDNSRAMYDVAKGDHASFNLLKENLSYILTKAEFADYETGKFCVYLEKELIKRNQANQVALYIGEYIPALCFYVEHNTQQTNLT